ncbi:MAG TPA: DoxX family protein [Oligoflexus sp.]|uniref:DoxX family protein n=1 Tax=Oligoflexus sp. TaxID=1971216 RepID=UPI002D80FE9D|nr:DoxX family protein [Oligoflexus sp.]HET9240251.1 DoxX family protein [Oligoflexus sp.]
MIRTILMVLLALFMIGGGINHFLTPEFYMRMMPPYIPAPEFMVALSGVIEVALGVGLLIPKTRVLAAWGIVALLIAVFPANIHMYVNRDQWPEVPGFVTLIRLPFQFIFIAWAWMFTRKGQRA